MVPYCHAEYSGIWARWKILLPALAGIPLLIQIPNPEAVTHLNYENRDARRFIGSAFGELQLIKGLTFKSQVNIDYSSALIDAFWNKDIGDGQMRRQSGLRQNIYA